MGNAKRLLSGDGFAHESITVTGTAIGFTTGKWRPTGSDPQSVRAFITAHAGMMRYRYDGSDPTDSSGHLLGSGDSIEIEGYVNVSQFKAIRVGDVSGVLDVTYERVHM